jgi:hypothetical protein
MTLRDAVKLAEELGIRIERVRRTGELRFIDPGSPSMLVKSTRKDAPKALLLFLRKRQGVVGTAWNRSR